MITLAASWLNAASIAAMASALATIVLAGFTYWLARETHKLAQQTEQDVSAQWRPVVVNRAPVTISRPGDGAHYQVEIPLKNLGSGPAFGGRVRVAWVGHTSSHFGLIGQLGPEGEGGYNATLPAPVGDPSPLDLQGEIAITYRDIGGAHHETTMHVAAGGLGVQERRHYQPDDVTVKRIGLSDSGKLI